MNCASLVRLIELQTLASAWFVATSTWLHCTSFFVDRFSSACYRIFHRLLLATTTISLHT